MPDSTFGSAGVQAREIDLTGPTSIVPVGVPAGIIGASVKGPAFVPFTLPTINDFVVKFGQPTISYTNGPLAANEWLRNSQAVTFLRVLGVGQGNARLSSGNNVGSVAGAGFVVGDSQPQGVNGSLQGALAAGNNVVAAGDTGRLYFLGCFMSQSVNSTIFADSNLPLALSGAGLASPIVRGVLMAASGVILRLSSSTPGMGTVPSTTVAATAGGVLQGAVTGSVNLTGGKQEFVMFLNGQAGLSSSYSNVITASFDPQAPNYFGKIFNKDPLRTESAGYVLYAQYDIHPSIAVVTGSGVIPVVSGANIANNRERIAFLLTGSAARNSGSTTVPSFENFEDRYRTASSPMFISQKFGGSPINLFRVWGLDDGVAGNTAYKISIENITPSMSDQTKYGTFDLLVRDFTDSDQNRVVIESWRNLSLDPSSPRFIGSMIGTVNTFYNFDAGVGSQKLQTTGYYANRSKYIRIELSDAVSNAAVDPTALPVGFRGAAHLVTSGTSPLAYLDDSANGFVSGALSNVVQPPVPMRLYLTKGLSPVQTVDKTLYWGVQFEQQNSALDANAATTANLSIASFAQYFPNFQTVWANVLTGSNEGQASSTTQGVLDADRFNNNLFSLEKVLVVTASSSGLADPSLLQNWAYLRAGVTASTSPRAWAATDLVDPSVRQVSKFSCFMQGGFDGVRPFDVDTSTLTNNAVVQEMLNPVSRGASSGPTVTSYARALTAMSDTSEVDIQVLTMPGIRHRYLTDTAIQVTENRFDAIYLMDIEEQDTNGSLVTTQTQQISVANTSTNFRARGLNSSFAASYFPDVNMKDSFNRRTVRVPPSVAVLGAFAKNDAIAFPWFAPAGYTRAVLGSVTDAVLALSKPNMDALYSININPIVSFAGSAGVVVWGQKTVQAAASSLDRVNVRRLLISLRRDVKKVSNKILFEQNRQSTLDRFSQLVTPILKKCQDQQGLNNFKVAIDTSTTTDADVENNIIRGKIWLQPTKTLEFLSLDFVLTNKANFIQG